MAFHKIVYCTIEQRTPGHLVSALVHGLEQANGEGAAFDVYELSYQVPDDITYCADEPRLADVQELASFPEGLSLGVSARSGGASVSTVMLELDQDRIRMSIMARNSDSLTAFVKAFFESFGGAPTVSSLKAASQRLRQPGNSAAAGMPADVGTPSESKP